MSGIDHLLQASAAHSSMPLSLPTSGSWRRRRLPPRRPTRSTLPLCTTSCRSACASSARKAASVMASSRWRASWPPSCRGAAPTAACCASRPLTSSRCGGRQAFNRGSLRLAVLPDTQTCFSGLRLLQDCCACADGCGSRGCSSPRCCAGLPWMGTNVARGRLLRTPPLDHTLPLDQQSAIPLSQSCSCTPTPWR